MTQFEYLEATSGYVHCSVFDCFNLTVGALGDVCGVCEESGCEPDEYCKCEED